MSDAPPSAPPPSPDQIDYYGTGLALLRDYGGDAVQLAAAILQNALSVLLRESMARVILGTETRRSPKRLALEAIAAFETAGGTFAMLRNAMSPAQREGFEQALRTHAGDMLAQAQQKPDEPTST